MVTNAMKTLKERPIAGRELGQWSPMIALAALVLIPLSPLWPIPFVQKMRLVGHAICHQIPEHSYHLGGQQLPLCARCTGIYLGVLGGLLILFALGKGRAASLPPLKLLAILVGLIAIFAIDGLNSYLALFPSVPRLYEPRNILRLATGTFHGLALVIIALPILNFTLWREAKRESSVGSFSELLPFAGMVLFVILIVQAGIPSLFYPLAIASVLGVMIVFAIVNLLILLVATRREAGAVVFSDALLPALGAVLLTFLEIGAMDLLHTLADLAFPSGS